MSTPRATVPDPPLRGRRRGRQPLTTEEFVVRARRVHGDRYDYGRVRYVDSRTPVTVACLEHGAFTQKPNNHLYGERGCPACGRRNQTAAITRYDTASFIAQAREVHGDRWIYARAAYSGLTEKLTITCPAHGDFQQTPNNHLYAKAGCPSCAVEAIKAKTTMSQANFEAAVRHVHGDLYGLELARYTGAMRKVTLTCPQHGTFSLAPNGLLEGKGCRACGYEKRQRTREEFISEAREVFQVRYTYDEVCSGLVPGRLRVTVTCGRHGGFTMPAGRHLLGAGCSACIESRAEREIRRILADAGIAFVAQWGHPTLRQRLPLRFDFMLPGRGVLIEFDGEFHRGPVCIADTSPERADEVYRDTVTRDAIKTEWAAANGWTLLRLTNRATIPTALARAGVLNDPTGESE